LPDARVYVLHFPTREREEAGLNHQSATNTVGRSHASRSSLFPVHSALLKREIDKLPMLINTRSPREID
ncbi:hypothetical protein TorRG33x02_138190, partial [Trema orientale]